MYGKQMIFDVSELENQQKYRILSGGISPRPIAWISTRSNNNIDNLAPYSFFTVASCNPPVLLYTQVTQRSGIDKDTLQNLIETGECVVNIVNSTLLEKMNQTSASLNIDDSEFDFAGIESCASHKVMPRSVKDSPIRYECTLREVIPINDVSSSDSLVGGTVILLDVQFVYVQDELYENGHINQQLLDTVGKMGGDLFSLTSKNVELKRP
ncbi:MAG: flavin reductase (DIM6/NTAB) family NADH-FMN oxidoreductase RutF [Oleispira sp.]|jgi:flavin reductase (DIM6/NTAB) family NADH-FMN oxidoreductase RutF